MIHKIHVIIVPNSTVNSYLGDAELIVRSKYHGKFVHTESCEQCLFMFK